MSEQINNSTRGTLMDMGLDKQRVINFHRTCKREHSGFTVKQSVAIALKQMVFESGERSASSLVERWISEKLGGVDGIATKVKAHLDTHNRKAKHKEEFEGETVEYYVITDDGMLELEKTTY